MASVADLGGLGAREGPSVAFYWTRPNLLPVLLPWLSILLLLLVKENRQGRAWWIWAPVVAIFVVQSWLGSISPLRELLDAFGPIMQNIAFGTAAVWLLAPLLYRNKRFLAFIATLLVWILFSGIPFAATAYERSGTETLPAGLFLALTVLIIAVGFNLAGQLCRRRYGAVRLSVFACVAVVAAWLVIAVPFYVMLSRMSGGGSVPAGEFFGGVLAIALVSFLMLLPFLLLSFAEALYRERLIELLRLRPTAAAPPVLTPHEGRPAEASPSPTIAQV